MTVSDDDQGVPAAGSEGQPEYRMVTYDPSFDDAIADLQRVLWSPDVARNRRYLYWKYHENPYLADPLIYLALAGDELVAMRGMYGTRWNAGSGVASRTVPAGGDTVVRADHQSRGLFRRINQVAMADLDRRGHPYAFNFSASAATSFRSLRCGWRVVGRYGLMQRVVERPSPWVRRLIGGVRRFGWRSGSPVWIADEPAPEAMARVAKSAIADGRIRPRRDAEYFRWRFSNPLSEYRFLFHGRRPVRGYLVLQWRWNSDTGNQNIIDWQVSDPTVATALLDVALRCQTPCSIRTWGGSLDHRRVEILAAAGFEPLDDSLGRKRFTPGVHVARTNRDAESEEWRMAGLPLLDRDSWDLMMICSDAF